MVRGRTTRTPPPFRLRGARGPVATGSSAASPRTQVEPFAPSRTSIPAAARRSRIRSAVAKSRFARAVSRASTRPSTSPSIGVPCATRRGALAEPDDERPEHRARVVEVGAVLALPETRGDRGIEVQQRGDGLAGLAVRERRDERALEVGHRVPQRRAGGSGRPASRRRGPRRGPRRSRRPPRGPGPPRRAPRSTSVVPAPNRVLRPSTRTVTPPRPATVALAGLEVQDERGVAVHAEHERRRRGASPRASAAAARPCSRSACRGSRPRRCRSAARRRPAARSPRRAGRGRRARSGRRPPCRSRRPGSTRRPGSARPRWPSSGSRHRSSFSPSASGMPVPAHCRSA